VSKGRRLAIGAGALGLAIVAALVVGIVVRDDGDSGPERIAVFGDSLTYQAAPYLRNFFNRERTHYQADVRSLPGTAICNWFDVMEKQRRHFDPQVVVFQFVGNDILPCMRNPDGSQLAKPEYLRRWERDTRHAIDLFDTKTSIYLIGAPEMGNDDNRVYDIWKRLAAEYPNTHFVDGGRLVSPHRTFVATLPCLPEERCTGPVVDGVRTNVVRAFDEVHFCPDENAYGKPCGVYASGAYRFAITIFEGVTGQPAPRSPSVATAPKPTTSTSAAA
jgi:hypothetical protein